MKRKDRTGILQMPESHTVRVAERLKLIKVPLVVFLVDLFVHRGEECNQSSTTRLWSIGLILPSTCKSRASTHTSERVDKIQYCLPQHSCYHGEA